MICWPGERRDARFFHALLAHLSEADQNLLVDEILRMRQEGLYDQIVAQLKADDDEVVESDVRHKLKSARRPVKSLPYRPWVRPTRHRSRAASKSSWAKAAPSATAMKDAATDSKRWSIPKVCPPGRAISLAAFSKAITIPRPFIAAYLGMPGTPMPGSPVLTPEQKIDLVHFVLSLSTEAAREAVVMKRHQIVARRVAKLPADPDDSSWNSGDEVAWS